MLAWHGFMPRNYPEALQMARNALQRPDMFLEASERFGPNCQFACEFRGRVGMARNSLQRSEMFLEVSEMVWPRFQFTWKLQWGSEFSIVVGNAFVETSLWIRL